MYRRTANGGAPAPRKRLLERGAASLAPAELLALVLRTGTAGSSALAAAEKLLAHFGTVGALLQATPAELRTVPGVGPAKAATLAAVSGLLHCFHREAIGGGQVMASSEATRGYLRYRIGQRQREIFGALFLDARNQLIADEEIFRGSVNRASVFPREVILASMRHNASALILYHNHPSGVALPSKSDLDITRRIKKLLDELDVQLLDHVVVAGCEQYSFAESGALP